MLNVDQSKSSSKMSPIVRIGLDTDINGILTLQEQNLYANLAPTELDGGFVMTPLTSDLLQILLDRSGIFVAEEQGKIIGYLCAADWDFFARWEIFRVMMSRLPALKFADIPMTVADSFQYGPVCIDRVFRSNGILTSLFTKMRSSFAPKFPIGITFINKLNQRSFVAHTRKLDFEVVDEFEFNSHSFYTLVFKTIKQ